ncbi:adenosine deaminase [Aspergillus lucknowensis]|uniref:Adenine deaminase n=1 Tax=Aspergillus lucknowensis TaxID=176173 RepID=A0ABR4M7H4_9EURO
MCKSPSTNPNWHTFLTRLPKCEHHVHLEGCLTPSLIFHLASKNNVRLPNPAENPAYASIDTLTHRYGHFTSLDDFLSFYFTGMAVLQHKSDFEELAWSYFQQAHKDGVHHAEVFFDPQVHRDRGVPYSDIVDGYVAGCRRAERAFGMTTRLIMCFLRHLPLESAEKLYATALEAGDLKPHSDSDDEESRPRIHGIGCSSSEIGPPKDMYAAIYASAASKGINRTAHAGEEGDASYVAAALEFGATRIDHGVRLAEDPELMAQIAQRGTLLTVCPVSNVQLKCFDSISDVPIRKFLDAGVRFSINSDDPAYFGAYVLDCYCAVQEAFGLSVEEWRVIAENGVNGSWVGEGRKRELLEGVDRLIEEFKGLL